MASSKAPFPLPWWEGIKGRGRIFAVCKFLMLGIIFSILSEKEYTLNIHDKQ